MPDRPIGVVAGTLPRAKAIIAELGLTNARAISRRGSGRGLTLSALILDESALPLKDGEYEDLIPTLLPDHCGQVYELRRHRAL